jgi:hypothetical protein
MKVGDGDGGKSNSSSHLFLHLFRIFNFKLIQNWLLSLAWAIVIPPPSTLDVTHQLDASVTSLTPDRTIQTMTTPSTMQALPDPRQESSILNTLLRHPYKSALNFRP